MIATTADTITAFSSLVLAFATFVGVILSHRSSSAGRAAIETKVDDLHACIDTLNTNVESATVPVATPTVAKPSPWAARHGR